MDEVGTDDVFVRRPLLQTQINKIYDEKDQASETSRYT